jgi:hypothetical protein
LETVPPSNIRYDDGDDDGSRDCLRNIGLYFTLALLIAREGATAFNRLESMKTCSNFQTKFWTLSGFCEYSNEGREFLEQPTESELLDESSIL